MSFLTGSPSQSSSSQSSSSTYGNQAFAPLNTDLSPLLTGAGGSANMMSALLGLNGPTGAQAPTYQPWNTGSSAYGGGAVPQVNSSSYIQPSSSVVNPQYGTSGGGKTATGNSGSGIWQGNISLGDQPSLPPVDGGGSIVLDPSSAFGGGGGGSDPYGGQVGGSSYDPGGFGGSFTPDPSQPFNGFGGTNIPVIQGAGGGYGYDGAGPNPTPGQPGSLPSSPGGGGGGGTPATGGTTTPPTNPYTTPTAANAAQALNDFANSTGMQFVLNQGTQAVDQGAAGKGMMLSGDTLKQLEQYGQGVGQTYLNQYAQNMNSLMGNGAEAGRDLAIAGTSGTSSSSGSGTGTGQKPGLLQDITGAVGAAGGGQGIAAILPFIGA